MRRSRSPGLFSLPSLALPVLALLGSACSPRVESSPERSGNASVPQATLPAVPSSVGETCGASADCERDLRCVDAVCLPERTSRLGDYQWAAGRAALDKGDPVAATEALQRAVAQYETEELPAPAALLCDTGAALARREGDARAGELAATLLHRCVLTAPAGGHDYHRGLAALASLEAIGLEPSLVGRDTVADSYLVGTARPSGEPPIMVTPVAAAKDKGFTAFTTNLSTTAKTDLLNCHTRFTTATKKTQLAVGLDLKNKAVLGDDDAVVGAKLDATLALTSPDLDATAAECVRAAVAKAAQEFAKDRKASSGSWSGTITVTIGRPQ